MRYDHKIIVTSYIFNIYAKYLDTDSKKHKKVNAIKM